MRTYSFRLKPGQDLRQEIQKIADKNRIKAGFVVTCVGGLQKAILRMAGATPDDQVVNTYEGKFEIVSLVGTVSSSGSHLHVSISDQEGKVIGGHLKDGSIYTREFDSNTGFKELTVKSE
jgi:predicted DNA-binding protein with PD1-like motif